MWWWLLLFSCSVVSDYSRPPCPSPSPGVCSNSWPLSRWYHWTISSCHPFSSWPQSFSSSESFPMSQLFASAGQSIRASALIDCNNQSFSFSISPSNGYSGLISFRMDWFDLLAVLGTLKSLLQHTTVQKLRFFYSLLSNSHIHTHLLEKL